jgi:hypothetical protein
MKSKNSTIIIYLLSYLAVVYGGLSFFSGNVISKIVMILFTLTIFLLNNPKFDLKLLLVVLYLIIVIGIQKIFWGGSIFTALNYILLIIFIPYFMLKRIGLDYPKYMVNIIFIYAIISLIFWVFTNLFPSFHQFQYDLAEKLGTDPKDYSKSMMGRPEQFILYTYEPGGIGNFIRNPGPFHEPGAFSVFLIYGIVFNTIIKHNFLNLKNVCMSIAILTTFSTSGYIALMLLIIFTVFVSRLNLFYKYLILLIIIGLSFFVYNKVEFLNAKIQAQYTEQTKGSITESTSGRFSGLRRDLNVLGKYPLWGRGLLSSTQADYSSSEGVGYGFTSFIARLGLIGGLLYLLFQYNTLKQYCFYYNFNRRYAIYAFIALLITLFGQWFCESGLFIMLFLTSFIYPNFGEKRINSKNTSLVNLQ